MSELDDDVLKKLRSHGTRYVWHYTACDDLPSIIETGAILCRAELDRREMAYKSLHYYGETEKEETLVKYVACAPLPPWGMMQDEEREIALLRLDPDVLATPGTLFCPEYAARASVRTADLLTKTGSDALEELYSGTGYMMVQHAEIFVPNEIPLRFVWDIVFFDQDGIRRARPGLVAAARRTSVRLGRKIGLKAQPARFPRDWHETGPPWSAVDEEQDDV